MLNWVPEFYKGELPREIKYEYKRLLAVGIDDAHAEARIISAYLSQTNGTQWENGRLWLALALAQWELGRLSQEVRSVALQWLQEPHAPFSESALLHLEEALNAPMPPRKAIPRARPIKCPWKAGDLLAYRISTCVSKAENPYWGKYVLLRVAAVKQWPISALAPDALHNESMMVALYNWVGDEIPSCDIADTLDFTPINIRKPMMSARAAQDLLSRAQQYPAFVDQVRESVLSTHEEYCCVLDWGRKKDYASVITCIGHGERFDPAASGLDVSPRSYSLAGLSAFDIVLTNRLVELFGM